MPFCGNFDWDNELCNPVHYRPMYYCDWEDNVRKVLDHNEDRWMDAYIENMPYWGA
jgi:hypothetical protein